MHRPVILCLRHGGERPQLAPRVAPLCKRGKYVQPFVLVVADALLPDDVSCCASLRQQAQFSLDPEIIEGY